MLHEITLIGFVGQDPQLRYTPDGTPVVNFSVATRQVVSKERSAKCPDGWKESLNGQNWELTTWWRVAAWRKLAEAINTYGHSGMQVYVEGELRGEAKDGTQTPRIWTGNDGESRAAYELNARVVKFLGKREGNGNGGTPNEAPPTDITDDELPF